VIVYEVTVTSCHAVHHKWDSIFTGFSLSPFRYMYHSCLLDFPVIVYLVNLIKYDFQVVCLGSDSLYIY